MLVPHWNAPPRAILTTAAPRAALLALAAALAAAVLLSRAPTDAEPAADRPVFARRVDAPPPAPRR